MEREFGARRARHLHCSVDIDLHRPTESRRDVDLGYLGSYSVDRQPALEQLLNEPARRLPKRRFAVAGAEYPSRMVWPKNVQRIDHMVPGGHVQFYGRQRFTLHLTPATMRQAGCSPSMPLLEAAACGTPIISDEWEGIEELLEPGKEVLLAHSAAEMMYYLESISDAQAEQIAAAARERVCARDNSVSRAGEFMRHLEAAREPSVRSQLVGARVVVAS